ncbi:peptidase T [candidate division KSB1 bacterium]|nr:peptidase T [candidate division KSB1 bacterium]
MGSKTETVLDRFLRYVKIDTQSQEDSKDYPSTKKQFDLARLLKAELEGLSLKDVRLDKWGYVTATLPANLPPDWGSKKGVPVVGLLAHMDTSPEVSGTDIKPRIHKNYQGGDIPLKDGQVIKVDENPELKNNIGNDVVTSDGTTLLGADDKAGIAGIMTALEGMVNDPKIYHGEIRIGFTPDEEVGQGTDHFDVHSFGAEVAYTVDGSTVGEVENETFNAATATFKIMGINVHPGYAKGKMVNALRAASEIVSRLPRDTAPETTEKREGYLHPHMMEGRVEEATVKVLVRDFEMKGMEEKGKLLEKIRDEVTALFPRIKIDLNIKESYRNMRFKLDEDPRAMEYALEAVRMAGIEPKPEIIRGGTDGARLCYMGLLTPNIFTGGQNFHSKLEWIPVQGMEKAVETILNLVQIWVEKSRV